MPCVSSYFYTRNPVPAVNVLVLAEMFPSTHWSCFLVPFHSQLSPASSQEPPVTHLKYSEDKPVLINKHCCPVATLPAPPLSEALPLVILSYFCALVFLLYNLLLPF